MRILKLELKRILNTRITWILLALCLFLSVCMAYLPVTFLYHNYTDKNGNEIELTGLDALKYEKSQQKDLSGEVTPEKVRDALQVYQACLNEYGVKEPYELPDGVYSERMTPYTPLLHGLKEAFADPDTGIAPSLMDIDPKEVDDFYSKCDDRVVSLMKMEQADHPAAQNKAVSLYQQVEKPMFFYPGLDSNVIEYQLFLAFLILMICTLITAPVFSSDYQTGADDILRCTKHGRVRLCVTRIICAMCICGIIYVFSSAIYIIVSNSLFGWESTKTSMQLIFSITNLANLNLGQLQFIEALAGLLSLMAATSLTLFFSSKAKNTMISAAAALLFCILPIMIYMILPGDISLWIRSFLPACGLALQSSFLYALIEFQFLNIGNLAIWSPYAIIGFAALEIPLFLGLTIHAYSTRKIK